MRASDVRAAGKGIHRHARPSDEAIVTNEEKAYDDRTKEI
jgi:hypothetical protein